MSTRKIVVLVTWVAAAAAALFGGSSMVATIGGGLFGFLVVAHAIECVVFRKELQAAPGPLGRQLVQTFLFGVIHMQELRAGDGESGE